MWTGVRAGGCVDMGCGYGMDTGCVDGGGVSGRGWEVSTNGTPLRDGHCGTHPTRMHSCDYCEWKCRELKLSVLEIGNRVSCGITLYHDYFLEIFLIFLIGRSQRYLISFKKI